MCGICGKLNYGVDEPVDPGLLRKMISMIHHRGPDGSGEFLSGPIGLGHTRLSIIDLNTGGQPMSNEDGKIWVVFNGEIYNYQALREDLRAKGHLFRSSTDTEVIVHLYEEMGEASITKLQGMFAFALWDERQRVLLLARDRVGIKPLYYVDTGHALLFASEMKSLLVDPSVQRQVNNRAIDRFLTYGYLPGNETLVDGILKLSPGHYIKYQDRKNTIKQYWELHYDESSQWSNYDETITALQQLLRRSVKEHMISDVPIGILLSGGVDSTGVLRYAVEQTDKRIHTFTIGFNDDKFVDERPYARLAAEKYGTEHHEITMTADDFRDFLPKYVWHMEEPVFEPPAIALYYVARCARETAVKVLLSGEGGDEAFGGYQNYRNLLLLESLKSAFGPAKGLLRSGFRAMSHFGWPHVGRYSEFVNVPLSEYYLSRTETPTSPLNKFRRRLYKEEFANSLRGNESEAPTRTLFSKMNSQSVLNSMLYVDTKTWLPDDLLVKADKMTMATSVELRVPLLDSHVLEFAAALPQRFKVCGWSTKRILKAALEESVPREILKRKKTGFPVPYAKWVGKELHDFIHDTILDQKSALDNYFSKNTITDLLHTNRQTRKGSKEIFCLLVLALWHQLFGTDKYSANN